MTARLTRWLGLGALLLATFLAPRSATAQSAVTPYFLIMVDTSGSMAFDPTVSGTNACGTEHRRISDAKCVIDQVVNAYGGDVTFGLGRFATGNCTGTSSTARTCEYGACGCNGSCDTVCNGDYRDGQILVNITPDNQDAITSWVNNTRRSCGATGADPELLTGGGTPIYGTLQAAERYLVPTAGGGPLANDPFLGCRPVSVIMLTDGANNCGGDPADAAYHLRCNASRSSGNCPGYNVGGTTVRPQTYVIGFNVDRGNAQIEAMATAGGTDNPEDAANRGFYADNEAELARAFAQIIQNSIRYEVCDGSDNDCDMRIDEGFTRYCNRPSNPTANLCTDPGETRCDGIDDNCDGIIDNGVRNQCGTCGTLTETCNRVDDDCDGTTDEGACVAGCTPQSEICNNADDDCDGRIDEGVTRACGVAVGRCTVGTQTCTRGAWSTCTGLAPATETCNGLDDDCDGQVDGIISSCGSSVGECRPGSQLCINNMLGMCIGAVTGTTERCDGLDNDCDGRTDEGTDPTGMLARCGTDFGACEFGAYRCRSGMLVCEGGQGGGAETCNNIDDDCDGRTDEGNPGGGTACGMTDEGACERGTIQCVMGGYQCIGETGPTAELCNNLDDDCDGRIDENQPEAGVRCGDDTGECQAGITSCTGGRLTCDGEIGPAPEMCNGVDDDCNGVIDDGLAIGSSCGTGQGECEPGLLVCDPATGMPVCSGEIGPSMEACNLLDDDCDGTVDESLDGGPCGSTMGVCMAGQTRCVNGSEICVGAVEATPEVCDCEDDDCDGTVDETNGGNALCPGASRCVDCQCALPCVNNEFSVSCPEGRVPLMNETDNTCFCVAPRCDATTCAGTTLTLGSVTECAPGMDGVPECVCRNNECTFPCDGVTCSNGLVCQPSTGSCVEDSCRDLGCPSGQVCNAVTGECGVDPCATANCGATQACRNGVCEASCATVTCNGNEVCHAGLCERDRCAGVSCATGERCDADTGACVTDACASISCPSMTVCNPDTAMCESEPCLSLRCPTGQICRAGECIVRPVAPDGGVLGDGGVVSGPDANVIAGGDAGIDASTDGDGRQRVLASGGGGLLCAAQPGRPTTSHVLGLALGLAGLVLARRRRR